MVEIGGYASQASGCCLLRHGQTTVLSTAQLGEEKPEITFFPLTCNYEERYYAAGKILGSRFIRREGRPSTEAVLTSRMIDRALRPVFPQGLKNEIQVISTCLSWDAENDPDILGLLGGSLSLLISEIPWQGPVAAVRVGKVEDKFILNPNYEEREGAELDLVLAAVEKDKEILLNMIEGEAEEAGEREVVAAFEFAKPELRRLIDFQREIAQRTGKTKKPFEQPPFDAKLKKEVEGFLSKKLSDAFFQKEKIKRHNDLEALRLQLLEKIERDFGQDKLSQAQILFEKEKEEILDRNILTKEKRPDGRGLSEIREIDCQVGVLPRTHGSGIFTRGETRVLSILTLGAPGDQQLLEGMEISGKKRFLHHYNFPPYSAGEVGRLAAPNRREIGHGMLVERALLPLIPGFESFPYTMRIVSEVLSSNGSTSMASVSSSSLALMDAGVPVKRPAAGIAIGLIKKSDREYKLLTDIQGPEDSYGDMDLKVAGTKQGITALQMDVKVEGINAEILKTALSRAKKARAEILEKMAKTIPGPRARLSSFAPRVYSLQINPEKIGKVIGSQGRTINEIIENCGVEIDIEESGRIFVTAEKEESAKKAVAWIKNLAKELEVGEVFQGKVKRILDFGAIVELLPGQEGLCHISQFVPRHIKSVGDVVKVGDIIPVKVVGIDESGRINLSAKVAGFKPGLGKKTKKFYGRGA